MASDRVTIRNTRREKMREMDAEGVPRAEIARELGVSRQAVSKALGPMEKEVEIVKELHVYCDPENFETAAEIALAHGLTTRGGTKAGGGSVGKLIDQIGSGKMEVVVVASDGAV